MARAAMDVLKPLNPKLMPHLYSLPNNKALLSGFLHQFMFTTDMVLRIFGTFPPLGIIIICYGGL